MKSDVGWHGSVILAVVALTLGFAVVGEAARAAGGCKGAAVHARPSKSDCEPVRRTRAADGPRQAGACAATRFYTRMIQDACARGGQAAAKKAMKQFLNAARRGKRGLDCQSCHTRLAPDFPLTADGLASFRRLGGN